MMQTWLDLARGPLFRVALAILLLGLARRVAITVWEAVRTWRRAGDQNIPLGRVARETLRWLVPVSRLRNRWPYSVTTFVFHVAVILVPLFLAGHVVLLLGDTGIGAWWPTLPNSVATALTLLLVAATVALVIQRAVVRDARRLSRFQDHAIPVLIALVFASGFLVMHPARNPLPADATLLVHALGADLLLLLVPITKLGHMVLLPLTQLVSELAWHFPPDAGSRVAATLGKEKEPV